MVKNIAVIRGDGIGPEIVEQALRVLDAVALRYGHTFHYTDVDMGGCAIDKYGDLWQICKRNVESACFFVLTSIRDLFIIQKASSFLGSVAQEGREMGNGNSCR